MSARKSDGLNRKVVVAITLLSLAAMGVACASLQHMATGRRFDSANQILLDVNSSTQAKERARGEFSRVVADLSDPRIEAMPPERRADGFVMRAYSEWRVSMYDAAKYSCRRAELDPNLVPGSHADVMSQVLLGLVVSSGEIRRWIATGRTATQIDYRAYERNFRGAIERIDLAQAHVGGNTPADTRAFVAYAKWRVASNWASVRRTTRTKAGRRLISSSKEAATLLQVLGAGDSELTLPDVLSALIQEIPEDGPLRDLAERKKDSTKQPQ